MQLAEFLNQKTRLEVTGHQLDTTWKGKGTHARGPVGIFDIGTEPLMPQLWPPRGVYVKAEGLFALLLRIQAQERDGVCVCVRTHVLIDCPTALAERGKATLTSVSRKHQMPGQRPCNNRGCAQMSFHPFRSAQRPLKGQQYAPRREVKGVMKGTKLPPGAMSLFGALEPPTDPSHKRLPWETGKSEE